MDHTVLLVLSFTSVIFLTTGLIVWASIVLQERKTAEASQNASNYINSTIDSSLQNMSLFQIVRGKEWTEVVYYVQPVQMITQEKQSTVLKMTFDLLGTILLQKETTPLSETLFESLNLQRKKDFNTVELTFLQSKQKLGSFVVRYPNLIESIKLLSTKKHYLHHIFTLNEDSYCYEWRQTNFMSATPSSELYYNNKLIAKAFSPKLSFFSTARPDMLYIAISTENTAQQNGIACLLAGMLL
ncbi:MAG: hypothetical protein ACKO34_00585 [Vampirovibrionales bacterium]